MTPEFVTLQTQQVIAVIAGVHIQQEQPAGTTPGEKFL